MMKLTSAKTMCVAVALGHSVNSATMRPLAFGCGKVKWMVFSSAGNLDAVDLLQFLDAALHLLGLGGLVAEAVDEGFQLLDLVLLVAVGRFQLRRRSVFCCSYFS